MATNIFEETIHRYGPDMQIEVLIEECAELIQVLQKWKRMKAKTPNANVTVKDIISECVDVEIMIEQMRYIFHRPLVWGSIRQAKERRLRDRLKEE